jgi:lysophospholipase L1-like esterase
MGWRRLIGALALGGLVFSGGGDRMRRRVRSVVAIGDSHTASGAYLRRVHATLGTSGAAMGQTGQGAAVIARMLPAVLAARPDVVVIQAGVNDIASGRSVAHITNELARMYEQARASGAYVVAVPVMPWGRYQRNRLGGWGGDATAAVNAWIWGAGVAVADVRALGDGRGDLRREYDAGDGLHLNAAGQAALGDLIAAVIR